MKLFLIGIATLMFLGGSCLAQNSNQQTTGTNPGNSYPQPSNGQAAPTPQTNQQANPMRQKVNQQMKMRQIYMQCQTQVQSAHLTNTKAEEQAMQNCLQEHANEAQ